MRDDERQTLLSHKVFFLCSHCGSLQVLHQYSVIFSLHVAVKTYVVSLSTSFHIFSPLSNCIKDPVVPSFVSLYITFTLEQQYRKKNKTSVNYLFNFSVITCHLIPITSIIVHFYNHLVLWVTRHQFICHHFGVFLLYPSDSCYLVPRTLPFCFFRPGSVPAAPPKSC